jgi:hypothetical protein
MCRRDAGTAARERSKTTLFDRDAKPGQDARCFATRRKK